MASIAETIAYFARRMRVETVVLVGKPLPLAKYLPPQISLRYVDDRDDAAMRFDVTARTLVAVSAWSATTPPNLARAWLNGWAEKARAVLSWDRTAPLVDLAVGFAGEGAGPLYRPFGLDLGFSMFDARLPSKPPTPTSRPIHPIIACYNEVDIIEACIESLLRDGTSPIVLENWSTDGTFEALQPYAAAGRIELISYPRSGPVQNYEWRRLLAAKEEIAESRPGAWIVHQDADEIRTGAFPDLSLAQNLQLAEDYGANAIDYSVLNFRPLDNAWARGKDPETHFTHFELGESRDDYTRQIKAWLSSGRRASLAEQAGHEVRFPERAVYPYKFLLKHYPLRSDEHGRRKLRKDRMPRFSAAERSLGWHTHYDHMAENETFLRDPKELIAFDPHGAGGQGVSFVTSLPLSSTEDVEADPAPIITPRVWLPTKAVVVIDIPTDPTLSFARQIILDQVIATMKASFETVTAITMTPEGAAFAAERQISCEVLDVARHVENGASPMARSIALSRRLAERDDSCVFGLAGGGALMASAVLKSQGLGFAQKQIIAVLGATTGQCLRDAGLDLHSPEHLELDHLEWMTASRADVCLAGAEKHAREWIERGVPGQSIAIVPPRPAEAHEYSGAAHRRIDQLVYVGPLAGVDFETLASSLRAIGESAAGLPVIFVGPFGSAFGEHAGGFLVRSAAGWRVSLDIRPFPGVTTLGERLRGTNALVILGRAGGCEQFLAHALSASGIACAIAGDAIAEGEQPVGPYRSVQDGRNGLRDAVIAALKDGWSAASTPERTIGDRDLSYWESWASGLLGRMMSATGDGPSASESAGSRPLVTVGIPHFERAHHLLEAIEGFLAQTYPNIEIIVVDDGSRSEANLGALHALQVSLERAGGRIVFQKNAYLGAARNTAFEHARGEFVLFFDDDDYPHPEMVERMMRAMETRHADVVSANLHFWESGVLPDNFDSVRCSSHFVGAAPSLGVYRNAFGSAAVLVRRKAFEALGGYTTDYGIGWEDYEFAARACLEGLAYENIPQSLYLYRVNYQGMASTTPTLANGRRIWRLLEQHADDPRLATVIRTAFMERLWRDDKVAKYQWHHTLGERTPLYHKLSRLPFDAKESHELLCRIAEAEGQPQLAARLEETLLRGEWPSAVHSLSQTAPANRPDASRVLDNAMLLHRMGAKKEALALLQDVAKPSHPDRLQAYIGLAFLYSLEGKGNLTAEYAAQVVRETGDDPEALFALSVAALTVSDEATVLAAEQAFEAALVRRLKAVAPAVADFSNEGALQYWANTLSKQGVRLPSFRAFPDIEKQVLRKYHGWRPISAKGADFAVQAEPFGQWLPAEDGVFLHPPEPGQVSVARLTLAHDQAFVAVRAQAHLEDQRAGAVEVGLVVGPEATLLEPAEVAAWLESRRSAPYTSNAVTWRFIQPGSSVQTLDWRMDGPVTTRAVIVATRMASGVTNNWHAATYVRHIRTLKPED